MKPSELMAPVWAQYPRIKKDVVRVDKGHITGCCAIGALALAAGITVDELVFDPKHKLNYAEIAERVDAVLGCRFMSKEVGDEDVVDWFVNDIWHRNDSGMNGNFIYSDDELLAWLDERYAAFCGGNDGAAK